MMYYIYINNYKELYRAINLLRTKSVNPIIETSLCNNYYNNKMEVKAIVVSNISNNRARNTAMCFYYGTYDEGIRRIGGNPSTRLYLSNKIKY